MELERLEGVGEKGNELRVGLVKFEMLMGPRSRDSGRQLTCEMELTQLGEWMRTLERRRGLQNGILVEVRMVRGRGGN